MAEITTREFVLRDYEQACALWHEAEGIEVCEGDLPEEIEIFLKRNPGLSRVAEEDGVLAGAVLCGHDGRRGWIYHLAVGPRFRGRGVGKCLVDECLRGLRAAGLRRALILVAPDNALGRTFWQRNGWEEFDALSMGYDL